jgi:hypothetical protein
MFRLIAASSLILPLVAGSGWKLNQNSAWCTGGFSLSRLDLLCDNDGACTMGEPLEMQGQRKFFSPSEAASLGPSTHSHLLVSLLLL